MSIPYTSNLVVVLQTNHKQDSQKWPPSATKGVGDMADSLSTLLAQVGAGAIIGNLQAQAGCTYATGTVTFTSSSGAVGATIGGTLKTVTWATSDLLSMQALIAAINSDTTINKLVTAYLSSPASQSTPATCTLQATLPGELGNKVTLVLSGTGVTVSGATLAGGVLGTVNVAVNG